MKAQLEYPPCACSGCGATIAGDALFKRDENNEVLCLPCWKFWGYDDNRHCWAKFVGMEFRDEPRNKAWGMW